MTVDAHKDVGKGDIQTLLVEAQTGFATVETGTVAPQKDENQSSTKSSPTTLGHIFKDSPSYYRDGAQAVTATLAVTGSHLKQPAIH